MAKRTRKEKELASLRAQIEILKSQLPRAEKAKTAPDGHHETSQREIDIRPDLRKTAVITFVCLLVLLAAYAAKIGPAG